MTRDEAKFLLTARRPNGADDADPQMAEALAFARRDPELTQWLAREVAADSALAGKFRSFQPPADLKERILAGRKVVHFPTAMVRRRVWLAASAAMFALVLGLAAFLWRQQTPTLASVKEHLAEFLEEDWDHAFDLSNAEFGTIRDWLAAQPKAVKFDVPGSLAHGRTYGCKTFKCCGLPATMVCFTPKDSTVVVHVFRVQAPVRFDAPAAAPQFAQTRKWTSASWSADGELYVAFTTASREELAKWL
jgi:hypothetical protein